MCIVSGAHERSILKLLIGRTTFKLDYESMGRILTTVCLASISHTPFGASNLPINIPIAERLFAYSTLNNNIVMTSLYPPQAMLFLYERGFPQLGHVQSGNVFVVNNTCLVGGYENTLLGYKTRVHKMCKDCLERLDVIMFG